MSQTLADISSAASVVSQDPAAVPAAEVLADTLMATITGQSCGGRSGRAMDCGSVAVTARRPRSNRVLPDDGIIDPIAVEIASSGTRPVAPSA
jgi:hypothetical protein